MERSWLVLLLGVVCWLAVAAGVELTFELPDNAKECFYEEIEKGTASSLEFQVVTGGHYDVDVVLEGPSRQILYREIKQQYGQFQFTPEITGTYQVCFSNEFSTFSHKLIYVDFQVGDEPQLPGVGDHFTAMTQMVATWYFPVAPLLIMEEELADNPILDEATVIAIENDVLRRHETHRKIWYTCCATVAPCFQTMSVAVQRDPPMRAIAGH